LTRLLISTFLIFLTNFAVGQIDSNLSRQVDSLRDEDQKWRNLMTKAKNNEVDSVSPDKIGNQIRLTDSLNFIQLKKLFDQYGYLGYDKVGQVSSTNFWLLAQHADRHPSFQDSVLSKMKIEAEKGNASLTYYAYLVDRVKINTGQLQIYGTQMILNSTKTSFISMPTVDPEKLNERRKSVGLPSIEDYIQTMNNHYYGDLQKK